MSTVLNVKIDPVIKNKARKVADRLGLSLSGVVNVYLRQFIHSQTLFISTKFAEPSEFLLSAIHEAEIDAKENTTISFKTPRAALAHLEAIMKKK